MALGKYTVGFQNKSFWLEPRVCVGQEMVKQVFWGQVLETLNTWKRFGSCFVGLCASNWGTHSYEGTAKWQMQVHGINRTYLPGISLFCFMKLVCKCSCCKEIKTLAKMFDSWKVLHFFFCCMVSTFHTRSVWGPSMKFKIKVFSYNV